jgi:hypothetical protein
MEWSPTDVAVLLPLAVFVTAIVGAARTLLQALR